MRAAGCAINDFADRDWDKHVKRTKDRPLTAGRVKPWEAVALFAGLCLVSFLMVVLFTNPLTCICRSAVPCWHSFTRS